MDIMFCRRPSRTSDVYKGIRAITPKTSVNTEGRGVRGWSDGITAGFIVAWGSADQQRGVYARISGVTHGGLQGREGAFLFDVMRSQ